MIGDQLHVLRIYLTYLNKIGKFAGIVFWLRSVLPPFSTQQMTIIAIFTQNFTLPLMKSTKAHIKNTSGSYPHETS